MNNILLLIKQIISKIKAYIVGGRIIQKILKNLRKISIKSIFAFFIKIGICGGIMYGVMIGFMYLITPEAGLIDIVGENVQKVDADIFVASAKGNANQIRISQFYRARLIVDGYEIIDKNGNIKNTVFGKNSFITEIKSDHEMQIENLGDTGLEYDFYISDSSGMEFSYRNELVMDDFILLESKKGFLSLSGLGTLPAESEINWRVHFFHNGEMIQIDNIELERDDIIRLYGIEAVDISDCGRITILNSLDNYKADWELLNISTSEIYTNGLLRLNINTTEMNYHIDNRELILHYDDNNKYAIGDENSLRAYFMHKQDGDSSLLINGPVDSAILSGIELFPSMKRLFIDSNVPALILASFIGSMVSRFVEIMFKRK